MTCKKLPASLHVELHPCHLSGVAVKAQDFAQLLPLFGLFKRPVCPEGMPAAGTVAIRSMHTILEQLCPGFNSGP